MLIVLRFDRLKLRLSQQIQRLFHISTKNAWFDSQFVLTVYTIHQFKTSVRHKNGLFFILSVLKTTHIGNQLEIEALPIEDPSKLWKPLFSLKSANEGKNLQVFGLKDLFDAAKIVKRDIVDPKNDVLVHGQRRWYLADPHLVILRFPHYLIDEKVGEGRKQQLYVVHLLL